jgi:peptidase E
MHQNNAATALAQCSICSCAGPVKAIERTLAEASGDVVSGGNTVIFTDYHELCE